MTEIRKISEATPSAYPAVSGVTGEALAVAWQRVEAWIAHRFAARSVTIEAEGPGPLRWPLTPVVVVLSVEAWSEGWQPAEPPEGPEGLVLGTGRHRIVATIGAGPVPAAVVEAMRRLAEYNATVDPLPGASSYAVNVGQVSENWRRSATWRARALEMSGAADLLRPFRRA